MYRGYPYFVWSPGMALLLSIAIIWSLIWKGIALWKSAQNGHTGWFVVIFLLNTLGILEIIYIFGFSKKQQHHQM